MIQFKKEICGDLDAALQREWLETNGLGGFASSTIVGLNTRRYHGLLVAATKPPVGRLVLLSKVEETLFIDGQGFELSANRYPGVVHPQGFRYLKQFRLDPFPVFTYEINGIGRRADAQRLGDALEKLRVAGRLGQKPGVPLDVDIGDRGIVGDGRGGETGFKRRRPDEGLERRAGIDGRGPLPGAANTVSGSQCC